MLAQIREALDECRAALDEGDAWLEQYDRERSDVDARERALDRVDESARKAWARMQVVALLAGRQFFRAAFVRASKASLLVYWQDREARARDPRGAGA